MTVEATKQMAAGSTPQTDKANADLGPLATFIQKNGFKPRGENNEVMTVLDNNSWAVVKELEALGISKSMTIRAGVVVLMEAWQAGKLDKLAAIIR